MNRKKSKLQKSNEELDEKIREIYYKSKRRYGAPKIYKTLKKKWNADITYIHTEKDGWTYLASVEDLYSRKIIGWAFGKTMDAELAKKALKNASLNVKKTKGIILQTDLGSQYTSNIFEEYLAELKIRHSYSRKGCPYDNSCIESFHSILKKEEVNLKKYKAFKDAYNAIFEFISFILYFFFRK